jgi:hypothetical protein
VPAVATVMPVLGPWVRPIREQHVYARKAPIRDIGREWRRLCAVACTCMPRVDGTASANKTPADIEGRFKFVFPRAGVDAQEERGGVRGRLVGTELGVGVVLGVRVGWRQMEATATRRASTSSSKLRRALERSSPRVCAFYSSGWKQWSC